MLDAVDETAQYVSAEQVLHNERRHSTLPQRAVRFRPSVGFVGGVSVPAGRNHTADVIQARLSVGFSIGRSFHKTSQFKLSAWPQEHKSRAAQVPHSGKSASTERIALRLGLGAHVKKGERDSLVVYANTIIKTEDDGKSNEVERDIPFMKG